MVLTFALEYTQFVVSGRHFTMNFLLLTIQSVVCITCVASAKHFRVRLLPLDFSQTVIRDPDSAGSSSDEQVLVYRDFDKNDARKWFPISFLLVSVIYTGSKALQFLSIPVYTVFKNLTIILIAYGEVIWFGGHVTGLTLISFFLMASSRSPFRTRVYCSQEECPQVLSSLMAGWSDIASSFGTSSLTEDLMGDGIKLLSGEVSNLGAYVVSYSPTHVGYAWMIVNCVLSAGYVLAMRKRIKVTNFKVHHMLLSFSFVRSKLIGSGKCGGQDWDTMFYNNLLSIPVLVVFSGLFEDWSLSSLARNLFAAPSHL